MALGSLGDITFEVTNTKVFTFDGMKRNVKMRIAKHEVIGAKPLTEVIGPDLDEIKFEILLSASLGIAPLKTAEQIYQACNKSTPMLLMVGGYVIGSNIPNCNKWIITDFEETYSGIDSSGCVWQLKMSISLQGYVEQIGDSTATTTTTTTATPTTSTDSTTDNAGITGDGDGGENPTDTEDDA